MQWLMSRLLPGASVLALSGSSLEARCMREPPWSLSFCFGFLYTNRSRKCIIVKSSRGSPLYSTCSPCNVVCVCVCCVCGVCVCVVCVCVWCGVCGVCGVCVWCVCVCVWCVCACVCVCVCVGKTVIDTKSIS